jgi:hypothetical protein
LCRFFAGSVVVIVLTFVLAPFIGMFSALADAWYSMWRAFTRSEGDLLLQLFGVADLVHQSTAEMAEEMGIAELHAADPTPTGAGVAGNSGPGGFTGTASPLVANPYGTTSTGYGAVPVGYQAAPTGAPTAWLPVPAAAAAPAAAGVPEWGQARTTYMPPPVATAPYTTGHAATGGDDPAAYAKP